MKRLLLASLAILLPLFAAPGLSPDEGALARLQAGQEWLNRSRPAEAWKEFSVAVDLAGSNYLAIEALTRMAALTTVGSRDRASAVGRMMALYHATPPRWVTEETRLLMQQTIAERVANGAYPEQQPVSPPEAFDFAGARTGLGFSGKRYSWIAPLPAVPPPAYDYLIEGSPVQLDDPDLLPEPRLRVKSDQWALTDPRHASKNTPAAEQQAWRFDRVLAGYTYEAIVEQQALLDPNRTFTVPIARWYPNQQAIWQLRFRVFYPSRELGGQDYYPLAQQLLQTLLRAHFLGVEYLGREAQDANGRDQILDVWLTPNTAASLAEGGGETYLNNLYFYSINKGRQPLEWVREALHEYSHAMMPKIGRYTAAEGYEVWLEGYLGERLLMRSLHGLLQKQSPDELDVWLRTVRSGPPWERYAEQNLVAPVDYWLAVGPVAAERGTADDRGAAWLLGFGIWMAEAHEPRFIHDFYSPLAPNSQYTWQSFERSYQTRIDEQRRYRLDAAAPARNLTQTTPKRADGAVELTGIAGLEYPLWLSAGQWSLRLISTATGAATIAIQDEVEKLIETGTDAKTAPATRIRAEAGWYRVKVKGFGDHPLALRDLLLTRD